MDSIVSQVQELAKGADAVERLKIEDSLRGLLYTLETPVERSMRMISSSIEIVIVRVAADLGLFRLLADKKDGSLSLEDLSKETGAAPALLSRILRFMASIDLIQEAGQDQFKASKVTHIMASPQMNDGNLRAVHLNGPATYALPDFLKETGYKEMTSMTKTPFQKAFNTDLSYFEYMQAQPKLFASFQNLMTQMQNSEWIPGFKHLDEEAKKVPEGKPDPSERTFLVDVGGGWGRQCISLMQKYPNLHGRLVLEDLPEALEKLEPIDGVKIIKTNAVKEQPVHGAKFYYVRRVLHNWTDDDSVKILQRLSAALASDSQIWIDEAVLPETGVHWHVTTHDLAMMTVFAAKERTRKQWNGLAEQAGLRIDHVHTYNDSTYGSVVVMARAGPAMNGHANGVTNGATNGVH